MIGRHERFDDICPLCGGPLEPGIATIPFLSGNNVVVIRDVPADICAQCHEPFVTTEAAGVVSRLLERARTLPAEVAVASFQDARVSAELPV